MPTEILDAPVIEPEVVDDGIERDEAGRIIRSPGRRRGTKNKSVLRRYEFIDEVMGKVGSEELKEFAQAIRKQFMDGTIPGPVATIVLQWALGKPKDTVEVEHHLTIGRVVREIVDPGPPGTPALLPKSSNHDPSDR
jgi:hypothetical protein